MKFRERLAEDVNPRNMFVEKRERYGNQIMHTCLMDGKAMGFALEMGRA